MADLVLSNGEITIRISAEMLAQKGEREVRELVLHLYSSYPGLVERWKAKAFEVIG